MESILLWTACIGYGGAGIAAMVAMRSGRAPDRAILAALAAACALHGIGLGLRWHRLGHGPFLTMFEILSSNLWSLALAFTLAFWRWRVVRPAAAILAPFFLVMIAWMAVSDPQASHLPPTYRTLWLFVHVGMGKVFLGTALVAVGLSGLVLLRAAGYSAPGLSRLPSSERLEALAFRFMVVAFLFESLMLLAGAVWAQDAWGRYWAWDPLETWAFVTWVALSAFIHARLAWRVPATASAVMVMAVFAVAFVTFFGVPFVSTAPHKGAV